MAEEREISLSIDAPTGFGVFGDPYLLAQAIGNLVDNAVKYGRSGGAVALQLLRRADGGIEIVVADDGPGIPDIEKALVTERSLPWRLGAKKPPAPAWV